MWISCCLGIALACLPLHVYEQHPRGHVVSKTHVASLLKLLLLISPLLLQPPKTLTPQPPNPYYDMYVYIYVLYVYIYHIFGIL